MFLLSLVWLALGVIVGALALAARMRPALWGRWGWLLVLALGALAGLLGGWVGTLLLSKLFGTPTALWVAVLAVFLAWLVDRLRSRARARRQAKL
ncbi:MAG TPA: hypothetical protein VH599_09315 [Ktedonobacterales bacterium]|jgi:uncharacterized membrane protein